MDVVDVNPLSEQPDLDRGMDETDVPLVSIKPDKASKKAGKKKKKRKGERETERERESDYHSRSIYFAGSLTGGLEQTLQSFNEKQSSQKPDTKRGDDGPLEFDEGGIELFENSNKGDEDESIVVRYTNKPPPAVLLTTEYSTVNEVAKNEERKQRKKGRKIPKSIQNALKSGKKTAGDSSNTKKSSKSAFSGLGNMGFKSKSKTNPLLNVRIPPTPPPTPATGASIAPSDEGTYSCNLVSSTYLPIPTILRLYPSMAVNTFTHTCLQLAWTG